MTAAQLTTKQVDKSKIWKTGLLAVAASVIVNLVVFFILGAILDLPSPVDFPPLSAGAVGFLTAVFTFLGVVAFAILVRVTSNPIRNFWIVATIVFILSILPNLGGVMNPIAMPFPFPAPSSLGFGVLITFHLIAYLITTIMMTTRSLTD